VAGWQPGHRPGEQIYAQHLAVPAQRVVSLRSQPDQRPTPVRRIVFALQQALPFQVSDDLADHGLRPVQVRRRLAYGERASHRQVLEHRPRRARQLAPGAVAPVKRQVDGAKELGKAFGVGPLIGHATRVAAG
jgi:hypothetical protein